jgi:hypothetical protein
MAHEDNKKNLVKNPTPKVSHAETAGNEASSKLHTHTHMLKLLTTF